MGRRITVPMSFSRSGLVIDDMLAYMLDKLDAANVKVVLCIGVQHCLTVYTVWSDA